MYANARKLEKHSLLKVEVINNEVGSTLAPDKEVGCKPTGKGVLITVGDETEHALLVAEVGVCGLVAADEALATADNAGNDLIADLDGVACGIHLDVLTEGNNLACTLVSESYGDKAEGVHLPLVYVGTANAASLNLYKDVVVTESGDRKFLHLNLFLGGKHSDLCGLGNLAACTRGGGNLAKNSADYCLHLAG